MEPRTEPARPPDERPVEAPVATSRPVVWPWLVVPAITLAVFFVLRSCQQGAMRAGPAEAPAALQPPATEPAPAR